MSTKQMDAIKEVMDKLNIDRSKYTVSMISHPTIEEKHGEINLIKYPLSNKDGQDLFVMPGYSFKSFTTMFGKLVEGIKFIENKYRNIYMINWGDKIKADSEKLGEGLPETEARIIREQFSESLAKIIDKCIRGPLKEDTKLDLKRFAVLGKSIGGGVSLFLSAMNYEINPLYLCCPGTNNRGAVLANRPELAIFLSWNKDDDKIPYDVSNEILDQFKSQGNNVAFHSYDVGGHELNVQFLADAVGK